MAKKFIQYFEDSFRENWELPAMTNYVTKQTYAYKDVAREVAKLHILFKELNITQDDKIALVGNNSPEWAITFLATITYGAVIVPILQDFHPDDIAHIIEHSESKLLFVDDEHWDRLEEKDTPGLRAVFSLTDYRCMRQAQGESLHIIMRQLLTLFNEHYPQGVKKEDVRYTDKDDMEMCVISYTSGTTDSSKGVMLTGDNFCCVLEFAAEMKYGEVGHKVLSVLPLAHLYGCVYDFFLPIKVGGNITFLENKISLSFVLKALKDVAPDWVSTVPLIIENLYITYIKPQIDSYKVKFFFNIPFVSKYIKEKYKKTLLQIWGGNIRTLFVAGAPLNSEVEDFLNKINFPFVVAYGMTECSPLISGNYKSFALHSVGKPITGVSLRIDSSSIEKKGEVLVKGRNVMKGYYRNEEATHLAFTKDGWLRTGDIGVMDKKGNLYLNGRCKTMILTSSGQNVFPEEIEAKLDNSPYVLESLVVQRGEKIVALIVPDMNNLDKTAKIDAVFSEQIKEINRSLPDYAYIHFFELLNKPFERTPKRSIKRYLYK